MPSEPVRGQAFLKRKGIWCWAVPGRATSVSRVGARRVPAGITRQFSAGSSRRHVPNTLRLHWTAQRHVVDRVEALSDRYVVCRVRCRALQTATSPPGRGTCIGNQWLVTVNEAVALPPCPPHRASNTPTPTASVDDGTKTAIKVSPLRRTPLTSLYASSPCR
jgi:hypothetical protein